MQGCVSRSSGDYILMKQNPAVSYQLQATGKIRLRHYLGQRVEVTRERVADHEHKFRRDKPGGFGSTGDADDRLNQDHRQGLHGEPGSISVASAMLCDRQGLQSQSGGIAMISAFESQGGFFLAGSSSVG